MITLCEDSHFSRKVGILLSDHRNPRGACPPEIPYSRERTLPFGEGFYAVPFGPWRCDVNSPDVVRGEGTIEPSGRLGKLSGRQLELPSGALDHFGGDIAAAAGPAHVVECVADGSHVEFLGGEECCFHVCQWAQPGFR